MPTFRNTLSHLHRWCGRKNNRDEIVGVFIQEKTWLKNSLSQSFKVEQTDCSKTLAYKIQMPGNYPKERIQHSERGESLKSRMCSMSFVVLTEVTM